MLKSNPYPSGRRSLQVAALRTGNYLAVCAAPSLTYPLRRRQVAPDGERARQGYSIKGYETMHMLRTGQVKNVNKGAGL